MRVFEVSGFWVPRLGDSGFEAYLEAHTLPLFQGAYKITDTLNPIP